MILLALAPFLKPFGAVVTQTDAVWWNDWFARDGMGWPLLFVAGAAFIAWQLMRGMREIAIWLAPQVRELVAAHVKFVNSLDGRLERIEAHGEETTEKLTTIAHALESHKGRTP